MNKVTFNRIIKILKTCIIAISILVVSACSNSINVPQADKKTDNSFITFKVGLGDTSRTVLPQGVQSIEDLSDFTISKKRQNYEESFIDIGTYKSYEDLQNAQIEMPKSVLINYPEWTFRISAHCEDVFYEGFGSIDLTEEDTVEITLRLVYSSEGSGSLNFSLDYSKASEYVDAASVVINTMDGGLFDKVYCTTDDNTLGSQGVVSYIKDEIPAGTYRLFVYLYRGNDQIGFWQEIVQIVGGLQSSAERELKYFNIQNQISFDLCDSSQAPASFECEQPLEFVGMVTTLPIPTRPGYIFDGWYLDNQYKKTAVFPLIESTTLYAKWFELGANDIVITVENCREVFENYDKTVDSVNIYVVDDLTFREGGTYPIYYINEAIPYLFDNLNSKGIQAIDINIDFTHSTGLSEIFSAVFRNFSEANNVSIVLPDSVEYIDEWAFPDTLAYIYFGEKLSRISLDAFKGCSKLGEVELSQSNKYFGFDENGVLYKYEDEQPQQLIYYPNSLSQESYVIPDSVDSINGYAFYNNTSITTVTLGSGVKNLGLLALYAPNLQNIIIDDHNKYYDIDNNGCLYAEGFTKLVRYFGTETSLEVNSMTQVIYPWAFYDTTLRSVTLPSGTAPWTKSQDYITREIYTTEFSFVRAYLACSSTLEVNDNNEITNFNNIWDFYLYNYDCSSFLESIETVQVYDSEELDLSKFVTGSFHRQPVLYKFAVKPDKKYKIYWASAETIENYYEGAPVFEGRLSDAGTGSMQVYNGKFCVICQNQTKRVVELSLENSYNEDNPNCYLEVHSYSDTTQNLGNFAFRILELDADDDED